MFIYSFNRYILNTSSVCGTVLSIEMNLTKHVLALMELMLQGRGAENKQVIQKNKRN